VAIVAHALLLLALTRSVTWQQEDTASPPVQAELWAALPPPPAPPAPQVAPPTPPQEAQPTPPPKPQPPPDTRQRDADIALERQRQVAKEAAAAQHAAANAARLRQEQELREQVARDHKKAEDAAQKKQAKAEAAQQAETKRLHAIEQQKEQQAAAAARDQAKKKVQLQAQKAEEQQQRDKDAKQKQAAQQKEEQARKKAADEQKQAEEDRLISAHRADAIARLGRLAGSDGGNNASATAAGSGHSMSASYGSRIAAKLRPFIVYTDEVVGNPEAQIEVRATSDGTILSRKVAKSSGNKAWDDAVLNAIDKAGKLPPDVDGRYPTYGTIKFRPKD
jgi:colicin import membrane protein